MLPACRRSNVGSCPASRSRSSCCTGWWLWGPPQPGPAIVVWVGHREELQRELFASCEERAVFDHPLVGAEEQDLPIRVCRGPRVGLAEAWPRLKTYR